MRTTGNRSRISFVSNIVFLRKISARHGKGLVLQGRAMSTAVEVIRNHVPYCGGPRLESIILETRWHIKILFLSARQTNSGAPTLTQSKHGGKRGIRIQF